MVNCPCSPGSDHGVNVSVDMPKPPSHGGSPIPVESPQLDESPLKSPGFLQNSNSDHSLTVASIATHWGEIALPSGALTSPCNEPLIDHGPAAAEPGSHGHSCAEQVWIEGSGCQFAALVLDSALLSSGCHWAAVRS
ncbi:hypothetical protein Nepgr_027169 [Nepenthes gracilis]|uniref:Uncharacterized protein n=1 Tax=Nepenthes gracilis TaxID=150966 RepID=A0AAD3TAW6_NEPGR|nr:hypothetical protein Nepgr_027169 [Nepenthes gracilis]